MRAASAVWALAAAVLLAGGCAELGVVTDGSSISYGKPNRGRLIDGVKLPDSGPGFTTAEVWRLRGNRYGTHELVDLLRSVSRRMNRMKKKAKGTRLVVADLSGTRGGAAHTFHRSHQSGRDVDLLYYVRDAQGNAIEPDVMRVLDTKGVARDGSGITLDVERTWQLVRELLTAREAYVQYIFMYRPIVDMLIEHAIKTEEPAHLIARAAMALKQPGDSAPHNDHMHVRIYCPANDRMYGCVDIGPLELLAEREAEAREAVAAIASALPPPPDPEAGDETPLPRTAADVWNESATKPVTSTVATSAPAASLGLLLRASSHRIDLRGWR